MFRFVGGVSLGTMLASMVRGGWAQEGVLESRWLHHPFTDSIVVGLLFGIAIAPALHLVVLRRERDSLRKKVKIPEFRWVGRRAAAVAFLLAWLAMQVIGMPWIGYRA